MQKKVIFSNQRGAKLVGILSIPTETKCAKSIVILSHGRYASKDSRTYMGLEKLFNSSGLTTLRFDFYGHGESEGLLEDFTITQGAGDISATIQYVQDQGYEEIFLLGSSVA